MTVMLKTAKSPKSPATASASYNAQIANWVKIQTVLNGTPAMRAAERAYLPQHPEETDAAYQERLQRNTLFNKSAITLNTWVGKPFSEQLAEDDEMPVPQQILDLKGDIDLQGNDMDVFARRWFADGMAKAFSHVLIDFPRKRSEEELGRRRSLADDREENLRPYWVHLTPEQVFFADAETINGQEVLREIRMFEIVKERDGFAEVEKGQIRRLSLSMDAEGNDAVAVELYRENPKAKKEEDKWFLFDSYVMQIDVIPLVTFYADRDSFMMGKSPLEDLVDINIAHWQSTSDQRAVTTVARFPMLALSGGTDDDNQLTIGPHEWLYSPDPQSKFYYVEHTGKAIEAGRKDLEDLEKQMDSYGAKQMEKSPSTATGRIIDNDDATSPLQDSAFRFIDAISQALDLTAKWLKLDDGGRMIVVTEFSTDTFTAQDMTALNAARKQRDLSRETYLSELKRRGMLDEELDIEKEIERLENEAADAMEAAAKLDLDPGSSDPEEEDDNGGPQAGSEDDV